MVRSLLSARFSSRPSSAVKPPTTVTLVPKASPSSLLHCRIGGASSGAAVRDKSSSKTPPVRIRCRSNFSFLRPPFESLKVGDSFEVLENLQEDDMDIKRIRVPNPQGKKSKKQRLSHAESSEVTTHGSRGPELPHTPQRLQTEPSPCKSPHGSLVASSSNTTIQGSANMPLPPLKTPMQLTFRKEDDSYVLEGDPIAFDKEACLAVAHALALNPVDHERLMGLSQRDLTAQVALSLKSVSSMTQHLLMRTEAAEDRLWSLIHKAKQETQKAVDELKATREAFAKKSKDVEDKNKKIDELNAKLSKEIAMRAKEFELNQSQVTKCSCKSFRLGWVQGQQKEEDRISKGLMHSMRKWG
ncbi:hypothetical protein ACLB2K_012746 [Fragaria x ananassa]